MKKNSRERVLAAIDHREAEGAPVDFGSNPSSGISALAYNKLKLHLGYSSGPARIYDVAGHLAQPEDWMLDRFGVDVVDVGRMFNTADEDWYGVRLSDGSVGEYPSWFKPVRREDGAFEAEVEGVAIARMPAEGMSFDQIYFPYLDGYPATFKYLPEAMKKVSSSVLAVSPWDRAEGPDFWRELREKTAALRESSDRAIVISCGCNLFEWGMYLRRLDNFLMDIPAEQDKVEGLLDALMEIHLGRLEKVCGAVGDIVDVVRFGDDLGMTGGSFMSPALYRKLFRPRHTLLNEYVHQHTGMKTFLHSCGSIYGLLPDLIEAGFDIINPVQTNCKDMEPARLKREFGSAITFWGGGCDGNILNNGTPGQVKRHVVERMEIFSPGGGFIFNTEHNILPEAPPQNVVAMFEAVGEYNGR